MEESAQVSAGNLLGLRNAAVSLRKLECVDADRVLASTGVDFDNGRSLIGHTGLTEVGSVEQAGGPTCSGSTRCGR